MVLFKLYPQTFKKVLLAEQNIHCGALGKRNRRCYDHVRMPHLHLDRREKAIHSAISNTKVFLLLRMLKIDSKIPCISVSGPLHGIKLKWKCSLLSRLSFNFSCRCFTIYKIWAVLPPLIYGHTVDHSSSRAKT